METENKSEQKEVKCRVCKDRIDVPDQYGRTLSIIIDKKGKVFDSEECLFYYHRKSYQKYLNRSEQLDNYIDLGIIDVKYHGDYYEGVIEEHINLNNINNFIN